ncbi:hypothetical protein Plhal304r1_c012g0047341 [Plasmopara halstedii]
MGDFFLGFEDVNLRLDHTVTAADANRWTEDEPLRLKYKRPSYRNKVSNFVANNEWIVGLLVGAVNFGFTMWMSRCDFDRH